MHRIFKKKEILTIPNLLSLVRLALIPLILWLYIGVGNNYAAIAVIILSGLTDIVDGKIARKYNMVSDFGKILDPIADKLTQGAVALCLTVKYEWMKYLIVFFVLKEVIMGTLGFFVAKNKDEINSARWHGKLNTVVLYGVMCVLILFPGIPLWAANTLIGICALMMLMSLCMYAYFFISILCGKRKAHSTKEKKKC